MVSALSEQFGQIDIYVFDQLLRGNIRPGMRVLDAGCGFGRNLVYLLREGFDIHAVDANPEAVAYVRQLAADLHPQLPAANVREALLDQLPLGSAAMDVVLCNSVLHFAQGHAHFRALLQELWRVLKPGGLLFCRLGSRIGTDFEAVGDGRYITGDGACWYLVDEAQLLALTAELGGELADPLKTTLLQGRRCMTTWVLRKR